MPAAPAKVGQPGKTAIPSPRMGDSVPERPLSAVVGVPLAAMTSSSKLYRWQVGKTLKQITELSKDDASLIMLRAENAGPVASTTIEKKVTTPVIAKPGTVVEVAPMPRAVCASVSRRAVSGW